MATDTEAKAHPREGYRRLAWRMVDEDVVYLVPFAVYGILDRHDLLYRWKRPEPGQGRQVPEATYPDEVWHIDLMYLWVKGRWYFLVTVLDSYSRYIVHWELALSMQAQEIAEIMNIALEQVSGKKPRIVRDNDSQFVAKEWQEVIRHFELEEIPIRARHPESKDFVAYCTSYLSLDRILENTLGLNFHLLLTGVFSSGGSNRY